MSGKNQNGKKPASAATNLIGTVHIVRGAQLRYWLSRTAGGGAGM